MRKITPRTVALALEYHLLKKDKAILKPLVPVRVQGMLRRRARAKYLVWDAREYNQWMKGHLEVRRQQYAGELEAGLLSIATPVWDGTPLPYLRLLAESIAVQNSNDACEWFVLDNGCTKADLRRYLNELAGRFGWVTLHREKGNEGIAGGLRICLERARNRYLCVVDSDDSIYPDCLQIVQHWIKRQNYPPLLYSDEDKLIGSTAVQPYMKPDFDPVLLLNSAYIAHLGVIERSIALELGAYTDRNAEGSPDWDCFVRFLIAGYAAVHIPEVIYSWRMHPESTADDAGSKPYIHSSQQAVLGRYLETEKLSATFDLRYSPLLPGTADWWIERRHLNPVKALLVSEHATQDYPNLERRPQASLNELLDGEFDLVCLFLGDLKPERADCIWEAQGLLERFPDAIMVGGWVADKNGHVADGPLVFGFDDGCGCPDIGRPVVDPGYFTQMRKQRSVSAVSSRCAVIRTDFLRGLRDRMPAVALADLGPWLGGCAMEMKKRIIFSPFLRCDSHAGSLVHHKLAGTHADHRYYPCYFGMNAQSAYKLGLRE